MQEDWFVIALVIIVVAIIGFVFLTLPVYDWSY